MDTAATPFGDPRDWRHSDLIAVSAELTGQRRVDPTMVLNAYRSGVFPMPVRRGVMGWYSPLKRGVLPLGELRVTRSLRKMLPRYEIRVDTAFDEVLERCGDPRREGAWINRDIRRIYGDLHRAGLVHSVESWTPDGRLAGGLYGVGLGGLFAGESMFHDPEIGRDASKAALVALVRLLNADGHPDRLLDVQWQTPHLASLGVVEIDREEYLRRLARALPVPAPAW